MASYGQSGVTVNDKTLQEFAEKNWARVPEAKRKLCVEHLRKTIIPMDQAELKEQFETGKFNPWFHFTSGMTVRNALRDVMKDDELPGVAYPGGDSYEFHNWDDFYMAALRQAVAPKEGEA
jgi:hypothetical protein